MSAKVSRYAGCASAVLAMLVFAPAMAAHTRSAAISKITALASTGAPREEMVSRLIVQPRYLAGDKLNRALQQRDTRGLMKTANVGLSVLRPMSGNAHVLELDHPVSLSEARVIAARLKQDAGVELAEPDILMHPTGNITPSDPGYSFQWHYKSPAGSNLGGANLPSAWGITAGNPSVTVAVLDSGYLPHADLGEVLPGYDFIGDVLSANDGDGRDADARDPGNWLTSAENSGGEFRRCGVSDSSWHGTHIMGTIAALMNNGIGGTGIAPNVRILPVRVLGKCGGYTSDIIDGMRWAAGIPVAGAPANPYPAQVLNMSMGSSGACSTAVQRAVTDIINIGKVIVSATGNDGVASVNEPANCTGVIAVTAHAIDGDNAEYANVGPETTISAPGGGCGGTNFTHGGCTHANSPGVYSLMNTGVTTPAEDSYTVYEGTSMAAPHVTGVIALMLSANPLLTPAQIKSYLQSSARPHPSDTICTAIFPGQCGAGLLDAQRALDAVYTPPPTVTLDTPSVVAPDTLVMLSGSAVASFGRNVTSYVWAQQSGPATVILHDANSASAYFTAPPSGTYSFLLTVTDDNGQTATATAVVRVNSPPVLTAVPAQTVMAGQALSFSVGASDADGDTPIFHVVALPGDATFSAGGIFNWATPLYAGSYTLIYYASDNDASSAQATVDITVTVASAVAPASGGGGGGGSMDAKTLAVLALLAIVLRLRHPIQAKWRLCLAVSVLALAAISWPEGLAQLRYDRDALASGEVWRAVSAHFTHLSLAHLFLNLLGLVLICELQWGTLPWRHGLGLLGFSAAAICVCLGWLHPELIWYAGLSGVLHGLWAGCAMYGLWHASDAESRSRYIYLAGAVLLAAKLAMEAHYGPSATTARLIGGDVVSVSHLYGALAGAAYVLIWHALNTIADTDRIRTTTLSWRTK